MNDGLSRRTVVRTAAVVTAMTAAGLASGPTAASAAETGPSGQKTAPKRPDTTPNGWPVQQNADRDTQVWTRAVAGTGLDVPVWIGDPEAILLHVVRRYHYEVTEIRSGELVGWQKVNEPELRTPQANLASGTAVRIRPGASAPGSLFPLEKAMVRDIVTDCAGVVRWGGDDSPADESLFYLAAGPKDPRVRKLADWLRDGEASPGRGAGIAIALVS
ncbi:hypothetical protein [Streptomyces sp. KMM 9044]|uniref:hypothetical protein n=1 Tax=Streptomyces sp. KMM 9044 TaxID=2744474 RepID=UPI0021514A14|nr:hypothetical protein [Streptomyces sp. KMM 9044]WAX77402.1 hypothetical protein HUV60_006735 [Streptomyces sp. KMM 9044]